MEKIMKIPIIIIDTDIDKIPNYTISTFNLLFRRNFYFRCKKVIRNNSNVIHGNTVNLILQDFERESYPVLKDDLTGKYDDFIKILEYIHEKGMSRVLINCSFGVFGDIDTDYLSSVINRLAQKQIFLICAASKIPSFPSVMDNVISVSDMNMYKNDHHEINHRIDFVVDIHSYKYDFIQYSCTSFAAPIVTAKAAELMSSGKIDTISQLRDELAIYFMRWR